MSLQVTMACKGWVHGGMCEPQEQLWALQWEVSVPCSRSPGGLRPVGNGMVAMVAFLNQTSEEKHSKKWMHKPVARMQCTLNASQAVL